MRRKRLVSESKQLLTLHASHAEGEQMTLLKTSLRSVVSGLASLGMVSGWGAALGVAAIATATPGAACNSEPYIGSICTFAFDWCPRGYMQADGRQLAVREYTALFGTIGFTYGGDNTNNFRLPDLLGRTVIAPAMSVRLRGPILRSRNSSWL
ncbi:phage tail protein [Agrobacterium sp. CG674]